MGELTENMRSLVVELFVQDKITAEMLAELYHRLPDGPAAFDAVRGRLDSKVEEHKFHETPGFLEAYEERMATFARLISAPKTA